MPFFTRSGLSLPARASARATLGLVAAAALMLACRAQAAGEPACEGRYVLQGETREIEVHLCIGQDEARSAIQHREACEEFRISVESLPPESKGRFAYGAACSTGATYECAGIYLAPMTARYYSNDAALMQNAQADCKRKGGNWRKAG